MATTYGDILKEKIEIGERNRKVKCVCFPAGCHYCGGVKWIGETEYNNLLKALKTKHNHNINRSKKS